MKVSQAIIYKKYENILNVMIQEMVKKNPDGEYNLEIGVQFFIDNDYTYRICLTNHFPKPRLTTVYPYIYYETVDT